MIKWLVKCLPCRSRANDMNGLKQDSIADILKRAPKGNMMSEDIYYAFDYDDDKPWYGRTEHVILFLGSTDVGTSVTMWFA